MICLQGHKEAVWHSLQLKDGRLASCDSTNSFAIFNLVTLGIDSYFHGHEVGPVTSLVQLENGMLVSGAWDSNVLLWARPEL